MTSYICINFINRALDSLKAGVDPRPDFSWQEGLDFDGMLMTNAARDPNLSCKKNSRNTVYAMSSVSNIYGRLKAVLFGWFVLLGGDHVHKL